MAEAAINQAIDSPNTPAAPGSSAQRRISFPTLGLRGAVIWPLAALTGISCAFLQFPFDSWWTFAFRGAGLYIWWPLAVFPAMAGFYLAGSWWHRRTGSELYFPVLATLAAVVALFLPDVVITFRSADRPLIWCKWTLAIGSLLFCTLSAAWVAFTQLWIACCNGAVVTCVRGRLQSGKFDAALGSSPPHWGSPHCLLIVDGYYREMKSVLKPAMRDAGALQEALSAAWVLHRYLALPWPGGGGHLWRQRSELVAEMLVICRIGLSLEARVFGSRVAELSEELSVLASGREAAHRAYLEFLSFVLRLAPGADERFTTTRVMELFGHIAPEILNTGTGERESARNVWMSIAPLAGVEEQLILDVWGEMHRDGESLVSVREVSSHPSPAAMRARHNVAVLYGTCVTRTSAPWNSELVARAQEAAVVSGAGANVGSIRTDVLTATSTTGSWPYREVWATPAVRRLVAWGAVPCAVCCAMALAVAAPAVSGLIGLPSRNTINTVLDNNPLRDYSKEQIVGMAGSESSLALGTNAHLILFDKASRSMQRRAYPGGVLSVIAGPGGGERFVFLSGDQGISSIVPGLMPRTGEWLAAPAHPLWDGASELTQEQILNSQLDESGWLVAAAGRGIARYVFENRDNNSFRTRSWQTSPLFTIDLQQAILTDLGGWLRLNDRVVFADRRTLNPDSRRELRGSMDSIDAAADGSWAAATDASPRYATYLFPVANSRQSWSKGYFSREPAAISDESEVTSGAVTGQFALLGSNSGLRIYDTHRRTLSLFAPASAVREFVPAGNGVLAATATGLFRVSGSTPVQLEGGSIVSAGASPDGALAIWRRDLSKGSEIRYRQLDEKNPQTKTLFPETAWKQLSLQPEMLAVNQITETLSLFVTSVGSFFYDYKTRQYSDCSQSVVHAKDNQQTVTLSSFSGVEQEDKLILSIADGTPQSIVPGEKLWTNLDPGGKTKPVQLSAAGSHILGSGAHGEIYAYSPERRTYLDGLSNTLASFPPSGNAFTGDLRRTATGFQLALLNHGQTAVYDSGDGRFADEKNAVSESEISQVRLSDRGQVLYLTKEGQIKGSDLKVLFGSGVAPFDVAQVTAIAVGQDRGSILVGGPNGRIAKYDYGRGAWSTPGAAPGIGAVISLKESADGVLASFSSGAYRFISTERIVPFGGYKRMVMSSAGKLFGLDSGGVDIYSNPVSQKPERRLADAQGMKPFVAGSIFAWRNSRDSITFFRSSGAVGRYDSDRDVWGEFDPGLGRPSAFQYGTNCLFVAYETGYVVQFLSAELSPKILQRPEGGASAVSIRAAGAGLRAVYTANGRLYLKEWDADGKSAQVPPPWGGMAPAPIDLARTVYAEESADAIRFLDASGNLAAFHRRTGSWDTVRAAHGGSVTGLRIDGGILTGFKLAAPSGPSEFVPLDGTSGDAPRVLVPLPADGPLLVTRNVRVVRSRGIASFEIDGVPLTPHDSGFEEHMLDGARLDADGNIWGVHHGTLIPFDRRGGLLNSPSLSLAKRRQPVGFPTGIPSGTIASLPLGGLELQASTGIQGAIALKWSGAALPVWGSCGKLAFQCIGDIAGDEDGGLLMATELGLVVRTPDGSLQQIIPSLAGAVFRRTSSRLFLSTPGKGTSEWRSGALSSATIGPQDLIETADSGRWHWTFNGALAITGSNGERRTMIASGKGFRFSDDVIRWISRSAAGLCLTTSSTHEVFEPETGRGDPCIVKAPDKESVTSALLEVLYASGQVTVKPLDGSGRPAIERGKMFFDTAVQIICTGDELFSFVPGRGIFRRSLQSPGTVLAGWPTLLTVATLERAEGGVRLRNEDGTAERLYAETGKWKHEGVGGDQRNLISSLVAWRGGAGRHRHFRPVMEVGAKQTVSRWWLRDRFAWDNINAVGAVSRDLVVFGTAAGPIVARIAHGDQLEWQAWVQTDTPVTRVITGRRNGQVRGVAVRAGDSEYLVTGNGGSARVAGPLKGETFVEHAELSVGFHGQKGFGFEQSWRSGTGPVLVNHAGASPLFSNGQFSFDGAVAAAPHQQGGWWMSAPSSWMVRNEIVGESLVLRQIVMAPCRFSSMRATPAPTGICENNGTVWTLLNEGWAKTEPQSVRAFFRIGDVVRFDAAKVDWAATGPKDVWSPAPFAAQSDRVVFSSGAQGAALRADVFTSLGLTAEGDLAIGTQAGLLWWNFAKGGAGLLRRGASPLQRGDGESVERIRACSDGRLWARFSGGVVSQIHHGELPAAEKLAAWPDACQSADGYRVPLGAAGVIGPGGEEIQSSNDAWGFGQRAILNVIDYSSDQDALWLAMPSGGIVKLFRHPLRGTSKNLASRSFDPKPENETRGKLMD